jgi:hypothetical protein
MTRAQLNTNVNTYLPDNNTKQITPAMLRGVLKNMYTSDFNLKDDGSNATGIFNYITVTSTNISVTYPATMSIANYFLDVKAWYLTTIDGKSILVENGIYNFVKTTTGFTCKLNYASGTLRYLALDKTVLQLTGNETDPNFTSSVASHITASDTTRWGSGSGGGGSMTYPGAGIALSTGSAWGTSITNNSANWNTAYGWGNHASAGYVTGTPWTSMGYVTGTPWTSMGYLTSLTGAVLTDQTTGQTIGTTDHRLTKLWATDITCTNAITGSITGNAGGSSASCTGNAATATKSTNIAGGAGGSIPYQSSADNTSMLANGSVGQFLRSAGTTAAPVWSTPTFPNTATTGKVMVGNGTNWVESTPTFPNASATTGKVVKSDGTNWVASTETYAAPGTTGNVLTSDGTNWTSAAPQTASSSFWVLMPGTPTRTANTTFTITGDYSSLIAKGMVIKWTESSTVRVGMVSIPATYSNPNTTVTIIGDVMASIDGSSLKYATLGAEPYVIRFAVAGTILATATDVANAFYATQPERVIGADLQVGTAGTTNSTIIDININGTTAFTTKPTLATTVATSATPFTADNTISLALGDKVTIDIDAAQTTAAVDLYVQVYIYPTRYLSLN